MNYIQIEEPQSDDKRKYEEHTYNRSINGKICFLIVIVFVSVIIPLLCISLKVKGAEIVTCKTKESANILSKLDESIDPCDNFYEFACGNYLKNGPIPEKQINMFVTTQMLVYERIHKMLSEPARANESEDFKSAKREFWSCMNEETLEMSELVASNDILHELNDWTVLESNVWLENNFYWIDFIRKFKNKGIGRNGIFTFNVEMNQNNSYRRTLTIDQGYFDQKEHHGLTDVAKEYSHLMIEFVKKFGASQTLAEDKMNEVLKFEGKLANISVSSGERHNKTTQFHSYTVSELQNQYPYLNWLEYFDAILTTDSKLTANETIIDRAPAFFNKLGPILKETSNRTIVYYLLWRAIESSTVKLSKGIQDDNSLTEKWRRCVLKISDPISMSIPSFVGIDLLPFPTVALTVGSQYTQRYVDEKLKKSVSDMAEDIRNIFLENIREIDWIDDKTRYEAMNKAQKIKFHIAYPEIVDSSSELFSWFSVNAFYRHSSNAMCIPSTILHESFYSTENPNYVNYARLGSIVGREITHSFDGVFNFDWWTKESFLERAQCIIDQYGNFTVQNIPLNSKLTENDDIADNGGVKMADFAYKKWVMRHGPEHLLPNLKYNQEQLFWISYAQTWCSRESTDYAKKLLETENHSPNKFRVIGSIINMPDSTFAKDFKCAKGTKMNPIEKCTVW